jgi:hypothetical protein
MTIIRFSEILKNIVQSEEKLSVFYLKAAERLRDHRSREVIELLQAEQDRVLETLSGMNLKAYKDAEFVKNPPEVRDVEFIIDERAIVKDSPGQILARILNFEEKLKEYYTHVRNVLAFDKDREIMDMLIQMKLNQIKRIKSYIDDFNLVI